MRRRGWQHLGLCVPIRWLHRQQRLLSVPHRLGHRHTGPFAYDAGPFAYDAGSVAYDAGSVAYDAGPIDSAVANAEPIVYEFDVYAADTFTHDAWSSDVGTNACYKPPYANHTGFGNDNCDCKSLQSRNEQESCISYA